MPSIATVWKFAALLSLAGPATAAPITFSFTGTVFDGTAALIGQTLSGWLTYDTALTVNVATCCTLGDVSQRQDATTLPGATPYAFGSVQLSGGLQVQTGSGSLSNFGRSQVTREAGEEGMPGPLNEFSVSAGSSFSDGTSTSISLNTRDQLGAASLMFANPAGGLANDQPIRWLTPGSRNNGSIIIASGGAATVQGLFTLTSVSVVPEPQQWQLLLAGLVLTGVATTGAWRRARPSAWHPSGAGRSA